jgi:predicted Zn-dependent protease
MTKLFRQKQKEGLKELGDALFNELKTEESLTLVYSGEQSLFVRINEAKVRQATHVDQGYLTLDFIVGQRHTEANFSLTGELSEDLKRANDALQSCRKDCETLPDDPFIVLPEAGDGSDEDHYGESLPLDELAATLIKPAASQDLVGLYASGLLMRAQMNSKGVFHWFSTETFYFDYSLYTRSQKAIKATYAGSNWLTNAYEGSLQQAKKQLEIMEGPSKKLKPGAYRVYLAPSAAADLITQVAYSGLSERSLRQAQSPLKKLAEGELKLSPLLSLDEDFQSGFVPRFNENGELSPMTISLIKQGQLGSMLINRRTAQEYDLVANAANASETSRSLKVHPGSLKDSDILKKLDTGVYISNLHYLNWSDMQNGRVTGMTRYGCFWVENGEIVSPMQDMRFDDTLYNFLGTNLEGLGDHSEFIPQIMSYGERSLGGAMVPGMLLDSFVFTL